MVEGLIWGSIEAKDPAKSPPRDPTGGSPRDPSRGPHEEDEVGVRASSLLRVGDVQAVCGYLLLSHPVHITYADAGAHYYTQPQQTRSRKVGAEVVAVESSRM